MININFQSLLKRYKISNEENIVKLLFSIILFNPLLLIIASSILFFFNTLPFSYIMIFLPFLCIYVIILVLLNIKKINIAIFLYVISAFLLQLLIFSPNLNQLSIMLFILNYTIIANLFFQNYLVDYFLYYVLSLFIVKSILLTYDIFIIHTVPYISLMVSLTIYTFSLFFVLFVKKIRLQNINDFNILKHSELLAEALDKAPVYIIICDALKDDYPIIYVNAEFEKLTGYSKEEAIGKNPRFLQGDVKEQPELDAIRNGLRTGTSCRTLIKNFRKDGTLFWNMLYISPVKNDNDIITHFIGISNDVTIEKKLQISLLENEDKILLSQEYSRTGICDFNLNSQEIILSEQASALLGLKKEKNMIDFNSFLNSVYSDDRIIVQYSLSKSYTIGDRFYKEHRFLQPDNSINWLVIVGKITYNGIDNSFHILGLIQDITERKQTENELHIIEERLKLSFEAANDGLWDWDLINKNIYYSPTWKKQLGYKDSELENIVGLAERLSPPEEWIKLLQTIKNETGKGSSRIECELKMWHKNGYLVNILTRTLVIRDSNNKIIRYIGTHTDLTEKYRIIEALKIAKDEAIKANQAKSDFLASMSHELRTPLNAILGFGQILELDESLDSSQLEYTREILEGGNHLLTLIDEILDLAKIESGKTDLNIEHLDCVSIINECIGMVSTLADSKNIQIYFEQEKQIGIFADRTRMKQVIINIISNAIKYNRDHGEVYVSISLSPSSVKITITDTGFGIPASKTTDLFKPFNRLGRESGDIQGTGIGLFYAKKLTELMNGSIEFESIVDKGSIFSINIPISDEVSITRKEKKFNHGNSGYTHARVFLILYIEDNSSNMRLVTQILSQRSHIQLITATTGIKGLELIKTMHPKLILLDLNLPDMSGFEVMRSIRQNKRAATIPVIAVTANAMLEEIDEMNSYNFADYISKPIDVNTFLDVIDKVLMKGTVDE